MPTCRQRSLRAPLAVLWLVVLAACDGGGGGGLGATCEQQADCASHLQCLDGRCAARCEHHVECGDGSRCDDGVCHALRSALGDPCRREIDCGAGQTCALDASDEDGDGRLGATCQATGSGGVLSDPCTVDGDCRSGTCSIGRCVELCVAPADCPPTTTCADLPRPLVGSAPLFGACLPATGVLEHRMPIDQLDPVLHIAVPSTARSFALVAQVDDPTVTIGVRELRGPGGRLLHRSSDTPTADEFFASPIRHTPARGAATLLVPNTPRVALETGIYRAALAARFAPGLPAPAVPAVTVLYKIDDDARLDLHVVFLDLDDHPCRDAWGGGALDAAGAPRLPAWQQHIARLGEVFGAAGIELGAVTYRDLVGRADLDGLDRERLGELLAESTAATGLTLFVVRSVSPTGVQALAGQPAPPRIAGTPQSGVVVSADALCYRSWPTFTRLTAHAMASAMGLFRNREPEDGKADPIDDSDSSSNNLMYFGEFGGLELSPGQAEVLRRYPGLR
jgi:hypothetical protein